jgi:curved DNA-binding protein CbpA
VNDAFALLHFPRRPWLAEDDVRAAFQRLAATAHPDRAGTDADFSELTRAYETLREPAARLRHLLALEQPELARSSGVPADLAEWFPRVAAQVQILKQAGTSPLAKALARGETGEAERVLRDVNALREITLARVRKIDAQWPAADFAELAGLLARLSFLDKWTAQLREGLLALKL